jgi:hypothetical protein
MIHINSLKRQVLILNKPCKRISLDALGMFPHPLDSCFPQVSIDPALV